MCFREAKHISRRDWLRLSAAGVLGASMSGWEERPIDAPTFMATILKALDINPAKKLDYNGFSVPLVDRKARPIADLF